MYIKCKMWWKKWKCRNRWNLRKSRKWFISRSWRRWRWRLLRGAGGGLAFAIAREDSGLCHSSGAGGSSYISGHTGSISLQNKNNTNCKETGTNPENYVGTTNKACSYYNNNYIFKNTKMIDGEGYSWTNKRNNNTDEMPSYDNEKISKGNTKSGHARITALTSGANTTFHYVSPDKNCTKE